MWQLRDLSNEVIPPVPLSGRVSLSLSLLSALRHSSVVAIMIDGTSVLRGSVWVMSDSTPGPPAPGPGSPPAAPPPAGEPSVPAPLGVPRPPTGDAGVDALLARLADADHLPADGHLEVYEDVHRGLRATLASLDANPPAAPAPRTPSPSPS
ncbi:hypothetical protein GCM10010232_19810 [Streptomyces amakusaensis]